MRLGPRSTFLELALLAVTSITLFGCAIGSGAIGVDEQRADTRTGKADEAGTEWPEMTAPPPIAEQESASCSEYESAEDDYAPIQTTGDELPDTVTELAWQIPADATMYVQFAGDVDEAAEHEGVDYIHSNRDVAEVPIWAAADGEVAYVRIGCPQNRIFLPNREARECGSGWGNHIIVQHLPTVFTRYAHLAPDSIAVGVGDVVTVGDTLGLMGNTGRSEVRHLHLELGVTSQAFNACGTSQSFERVLNPSVLGL